jgi:hypothetical protein
VRMRKHDGIELGNRQWQLTILLRRLLPATLKHPAVERDGVTVHTQKVA